MFFSFPKIRLTVVWITEAFLSHIYGAFKASRHRLNTETQARRQNLAARGAKKTEGGAKKQKGATFKNTVLDICSNRWTKREMGGHRFQMGGRAPLPLRWRRPCRDLQLSWLKRDMRSMRLKTSHETASLVVSSLHLFSFFAFLKFTAWSPLKIWAYRLFCSEYLFGRCISCSGKSKTNLISRLAAWRWRHM